MPDHGKTLQDTSGINDGKSDSEKTLRETVKQALLNVILDKSNSAAAIASAGRTLLEYFDDREHASGASGKRTAELSLVELDNEIAKLAR